LRTSVDDAATIAIKDSTAKPNDECLNSSLRSYSIATTIMVAKNYICCLIPKSIVARADAFIKDFGHLYYFV
jgi:hypothetical protein